MAKSKAPMTKKNNFEKKTPEHKVKTEGKINKGKKDVKMSKKPVAKAVHIANSKARMAIGAGEVTEAEKARKQEQDERTLYIRFTGDKLPSAKEVKELHSDIKFVRTPRTAGKLKDNEAVFKYAFLEFSNEDECTKAKNKLATTRFHGSELYLDYVGEKSKCQKKADKPQQLNPLRLFVCGLEPGVKKATLKEMFPKCSHAEIPSQSAKKGTPYGFVQFSNPGDAKSAFDAAQNLDIAGYKITVLYAKVSENKEEILEAKAKKRKQREKKKAEKSKKAKLEGSKEEESSDDDDDEDEVEVKPKKNGGGDAEADTEEEDEAENDEDEEENDEDDDENDEDDDENDEDDDENDDAEDSFKDAVEDAEDDDDEDDDDDE